MPGTEFRVQPLSCLLGNTASGGSQRCQGGQTQKRQQHWLMAPESSPGSSPMCMEGKGALMLRCHSAHVGIKQIS